MHLSWDRLWDSLMGLECPRSWPEGGAHPHRPGNVWIEVWIWDFSALRLPLSVQLGHPFARPDSDLKKVVEPHAHLGCLGHPHAGCVICSGRAACVKRRWRRQVRLVILNTGFI